MIQKTTQRQLNAVLGNPVKPSADGPEEWGQWVRNKHYSLEVTQHPIRARMCGFGDKDRRPLAPAAVAKMIVRREDNSVIDVDDVDIDFFLVTVDLWSADAKQEMNLVLHPSSADRYVPAHLSKPRKRGASSATPSRQTKSSPYPAPNERSRPPSNHAPNNTNTNNSRTGITLRPIESVIRPSHITVPHSRSSPSQPPGTTPLLTSTSAPTFSNSSYTFPSPSDPFSSATSDASQQWSYPSPLDRTPFQAPTLPSIHSLGRTSPTLPELTQTSFSSDPSDLSNTFRSWNDVSAGLFDPHAGVESLMRDNTPRWNNDPFILPTLPVTDPWAATTSTSAPTSAPTPVPASLPQQNQHAYQPFGQSPAPQSRESAVPALPRHTYTRTLVGPLSANAQRLQDEHRKPGIFFLFQDLSIRTEGTFRLRMRLMNVGAMPAPNGLSNSVHTGVSPVLAQIFTEPFTVYSAKRFPGVPNTTALSIAFGNQGQKLPLRNRHGTSKQQRRPRRPGNDSSDEDSA